MIARWRRLLGTVFALAALMTPAHAQAPASWHDTSEHRVRFVTVEEGVRLEVLDWGRTGRSIVLLAGSGNSAHVYDDFAPKLTGFCHAYGITRRGYGASSQPDAGYDNQRLADDILEVLDSLHIESPVLAGHSMAGGEMTALGNRHSDRLGGLVYLDALGDPRDWPGSDPAYMALFRNLPTAMRGPQSPASGEEAKSFADTAPGNCKPRNSRFPSPSCAMFTQRIPMARWAGTRLPKVSTTQSARAR